MVIRILEYAKSKADVINMLKNAEYIVRDHLIKAYFWRDNDAYKHWTAEIYANVPTIPLLKGSKKYIAKDIILEYLYNYSDNIDRQIVSLMGKIEAKEPNLQERSTEVTYVDMNSFKNFCDKFFNWVADNLSKTGDINKVETYRILDRLINHYPLYLGED